VSRAGGPEAVSARPTWDGHGTNFSLFSENADRVELCLFDDEGARSASRVASGPRTTGTSISPASGRDSATATASHGPWEPTQGHRFNPAKLLIDPYAKAIEGPIAFDRARVLAYAPGQEDVPDEEDSAPAIPRSVVHRRLVRLGGRRALCGARGPRR
jgi:glycogen operon protein